MGRRDGTRGEGGERNKNGGKNCGGGTEEKKRGEQQKGEGNTRERGEVGARKEGKATATGAYDNMEACGCIKANARQPDRLADKQTDGRTEGRPTPNCPPRPSSRRQPDWHGLRAGLAARAQGCEQGCRGE